MSSQSNGIPIGSILPSSSQGEFNALSFVIEQALSYAAVASFLLELRAAAP